MSLEANRERYAADLAYEHDLSLPQGRKLAELAVHAVAPGFAPDAPSHLADPAIVQAYVSSPLGIYADDESVARVDELARGAIDGGHDTAGAWFARACVAEHHGDLEAQRAHLQAALGRDERFGPALADLGFIAFVEGDATKAGRLLAASGDPRLAGMQHTLIHYPVRRSPTGRNEPCPCGSGAKHKHCCLGPVDHPLEHRAIWLWEKAGVWLRRLPQHGPLFDVACRLAGVDDSDDDDEAVTAALQDHLIETVALLDVGLLRRFLDRLGSLLPDDERTLAEQWLGIRHRGWHVEATNPGSSLVLSDLGGGDTIEAMNGKVSRCTEPGEVLFGPVVPTGDGWYLPRHPACLAPEDADGLVELLAAGIDPVAIASTVFRGIRSATM